jgi:hypothetical protein
MIRDGMKKRKRPPKRNEIMDIKVLKSRIEFEKELNALDKFVIDFTSILNKLNIKYVIVSGYVSILFGRSRTSEDIDFIVEKIDFGQFRELWKNVYTEFECIIENNTKDAYEQYLLTGQAIRFSKKGRFVPNVEMKFPKIDLDFWVLEERREVLLNNYKLFISPLELQIPFKLFLGSEKDIEDARHLYSIFKDKIDLKLLQEFNRKLKIEKLFNRYLE